MQEPDEDIGVLDRYQDIIQEVLAGRTEGHKCPMCGDGDLECDADDLHVRIRCLKCGRFFEGMLA